MYQNSLTNIINKFKAISDEVRFRILYLLKDKELCVCDLERALQMSQPRISQHLNKLKNAGLVTDKTFGKWKHYSLSPEGKSFLNVSLTEIFLSSQNQTLIQEDTKRLNEHKSKKC